MPRQKKKKKAKKAAALHHWSLKERVQRYLGYSMATPVLTGGGSQAVLGRNYFCAMIDEVNFVRRTCPQHTECFDQLDVTKKHDNEMLAIAEILATPKDVQRILEERADFALNDCRKAGWDVTRARWEITDRLTRYCEEHHFGNFRRKIMIAKIVKRKLRGHEAYHNSVKALARRIAKQEEVNFETAMSRAARELH